MSVQTAAFHPACPSRPFMSDAETACFARWIPKGGQALEFGMGGSTRFFFEQGLWRLTSVESDPAWVLAMKHDPFLGFFLRKDRLTLHHADIGPVHGLGTPLARRPKPCWLRYHQDVWESLEANRLDCILIDGRFRIACFCQTLLRCREDAVILFHDFWNRPGYHGALELADVLDTAESTVVLRKKTTLNPKLLAHILGQFQYVHE